VGDTYKLQIPRDDLHDQLGQGLPAGTISLVEGQQGAGKSALLQRMTYGFLSNKYAVTYISTEMTVRDFINQMYSLDYPVASSLLNEKLLFIPVYPLVGRSMNRDDFLGVLMRSEQLYRSDVVIIDTFSSLVSNSLKKEEGSQRILSFFKKLAAMGKSIVLSVDSNDLKGDVLLPFQSDSHIYLSLVVAQVGGVVSRSIMVKRFAGTQFRVAPIIGFRIEPNIGMVIEITSVA
jgi:flagellar protein FlaH